LDNSFLKSFSVFSGAPTRLLLFRRIWRTAAFLASVRPWGWIKKSQPKTQNKQETTAFPLPAKNVIYARGEKFRNFDSQYHQRGGGVPRRAVRFWGAVARGRVRVRAAAGATARR